MHVHPGYESWYPCVHCNTTSRPPESSKRLLVDGPARADGDEIDHSSRRHPVDDSQASHPEASQPRQLVAELLAHCRICANEVQARPHLALELGMKAPDELLDPSRHPEAVELHGARASRISPRGGAPPACRSWPHA